MSRVLFMGSDAVCLPLLEVLRERSGELMIVSQPDRPHGRGQKLTPNPVSAWALENGVALERPEKLDDDCFAKLTDFSPEVMVVMAYGRILKERYLQIAKRGTWNLHVSKLPDLRGASPIETAIARGDTQTGVCLMRMEKGMDTGAVAAVADVEIPADMAAADLRLRSADAAAKLVAENFDGLIAGTLETKEQDHLKATYCRMFNKADSFLDFESSAKANVDRVRAFAHWLGIGFEHGGQKIKVFAALQLEGECAEAPGTVLEASDKLVVATAEGVLAITELQRPGSKRLGARDFLAGYAIAVGEVLQGQKFRELVRSEPFPRDF